MDAVARTDGRDTFRPDIEGLRGIAVLLVVLFHSRLLAIPGGFVGVDVFFVISGFLITGLLIRQRERTGTIGLRAFYARRVRRLLPAGMVALAATAVAAYLVLPPLDRPGAALDAAAAALSVGNIRFALAEGDYFASVTAPSPFLHFWSLGVEEQFYLVWPAIVLLAARGRHPRLGIGVVLALVLAASLAASVVVSEIASNWAFYSLPTRAWQLSLGGLLALGAVPLSRIPGPVSAAVAWAGLGVLGATAFMLDGTVAYPGAWALAPTLAAAALVNAGMVRGGPGTLLATPPLRFLGRISYSLYLWHWPILVLPVAVLETEPSLEGSLGLVGFAVIVAWLSWKFVEEPFRAGFPALARYPGRTVIAGATAVALVVAGTEGLALAAERELGPSALAVPVTAAVPGSDPIPFDLEADLLPLPSSTGEVASSGGAPGVTPPDPAGSGAPAPAGSATPTPGVTSDTSATPGPSPTAKPVTYVRLPADVRPALRDARADEEPLRRDGCMAFERVTVPPKCIYGSRDASLTIALVGDSHAAQWFPALARVARAYDARILTFVKVACPFVDMRIRNVALKREYTECAAFREATLKRLRDVRPDLTIVSSSRFAIHPVLDRDTTREAQGEALARSIARIPGRVAVIVDTPEAGRDVPSCLSRHAKDVRACNVSMKVALSGRLGRIERIAARATDAALIDLTSRICRADPCPVVVDGMIVFRDTRHLTATFAASLAPDLRTALQGIVAEWAVPPPAS